MKRGLAILAEPANYTLDLVRHIYEPRQIDCVYLRAKSEVSNVSAEASQRTVIANLSFVAKVRFIFHACKAYDYIVVNGYTTSFNLGLILIDRLFFKKPHLFDSDTELRIPTSRLKRICKATLLNLLFRCPYAYGLAGGNFSHKDLFRYYGMKEARIGLSPMQVDNARYARVVRPREPHATFHFGYLGRLVGCKQVDQTLAAFTRLVADGLDVVFDVIGDGAEGERLREKYRSHPRIVFHGHCFGKEKIQKLHAVDCLVLFSDAEQWGLVVNEALASGIPCIVSDKVGSRNDLILGENPCGLVVPWQDVDALAQAMREMMQNTALYQTFQRNARARMSHWNYAFYGRCFDELIAKL